MITNTLEITFAGSVETAPDYNKMDPVPTLLKIDKALLVAKGMRSGGPSVDLQLSDKDGNQYVVMATGGIIEMLGTTVKYASRRQLIAESL